MWDFCTRLFDSSGFPPRWYCGSWTPGHGWLHILSNVGIWSAYCAIPFILRFYALRRKDFPFRGILNLFSIFILACGLTHLMDAVLFWWPAYRFDGLLKLLTAVVSWTTVLALLRVTPQFMALRMPRELELEIAERVRVENELLILKDSLELRVAERTASLEASEQRFRRLVEGIKDHAVYMLDNDGRVVSWNPGAENITGYSSNEILGQNFAIFYPTESATTGQQQDRLVKAVSQGSFAEDGERVRKDGSRFWASVTTTALLDATLGHVGFVNVMHDITEQRRAAEQIKSSLREKEVLLKEIHHRVKNNLQIVSSLLDLQSNYATDPETHAMFSESRGRVKSMALIHERLYRSPDVASVDFAHYIPQLVADLYSSYQVSDEVIVPKIAVNVPPLGIDIAIPCGLLLNELVSNCLKHAFVNTTEGCLEVTFNRCEDGSNLLTVADNGGGLPTDFELATSSTYGLQLVLTLVEQLAGRLEITSDGGAVFKVSFPNPTV